MAEPAPGDRGDVVYVGFWARTLAFVVDSIWVGIVAGLVVGAAFGADPHGATGLVNGVLVGDLSELRAALTDPRQAMWIAVSAAAILGFWGYRAATPGKMIVSAEIVDAKTLGKASTGQLVIRYLGYFPSALFLMLGFLWIAIDSRKRGWHDLLAGTVVVRRRE